MESLLFICLKLFLAIILGGIIGIERESFGKPAGPRTYALVTLGAALFTIISIDGFSQMANVDPTRIVSQIVIGIGFIGGGLIIFHKQHIEGLTTAASLWTSSAVGIAVGLGWYFISIFTTLLILLLLYVVGQLSYRLEKKSNKTIWELFDKNHRN